MCGFEELEKNRLIRKEEGTGKMLEKGKTLKGWQRRQDYWEGGRGE